jgi:uncharacterized protein (UPF0147 family)
LALKSIVCDPEVPKNVVLAATEALSRLTVWPTGVRSNMKSARAAEANERAAAEIRAAANIFRELNMDILPQWN